VSTDQDHGYEVKRIGLEPWPKLCQNLRSNRETELADQFPSHVASAWIDNSVVVALENLAGLYRAMNWGDDTEPLGQRGVRFRSIQR